MVFANIDGFSNNQEQASCGAIIKNCFITWVLGFQNNIRYGSSLLTNLWGFVTSLQLVWDMNITKIWVKGDSKVVLEFSIDGCPTNHSYTPLVDHWWSLLNWL